MFFKSYGENVADLLLLSTIEGAAGMKGVAQSKRYALPS